jgi:hypothetical protein
VSSNTLIEAILAKDPECGCETAFEILPLLVLVFEDRRAWEVDFALSDVLLDAGLVWHLAIVDGLRVAVRVCCVWGHVVISQRSDRVEIPI